MLDWLRLIIGIILAFIFAFYTIFWRCRLNSESEGKWFVVYVLIPALLFFGSITLIYFGILGLV